MDGLGVKQQRVDESLTPDRRDRQPRKFRPPARFTPETAQYFFVDIPVTIYTIYGDIDCQRGDILISGPGGCWVLDDPASVVVRRMG